MRWALSAGTRAIESVFIRCQHLLLQALFSKGRCVCHGLHTNVSTWCCKPFLQKGRSMCHGLCTSVSAYYCKPSLQKVGLCVMVCVQIPALKFASSGRGNDVCSTDADCGDLCLQATNAVVTCIYRQQMLWSLVFTGNKCCGHLCLQATNAVVTCIYWQQMLWWLVFTGNKCCGHLYLQATNADCGHLYLQATNAVVTCIYWQQMLTVVTCIYRQQLLWLLVFIGNKCWLYLQAT